VDFRLVRRTFVELLVPAAPLPDTGPHIGPRHAGRRLGDEHWRELFLHEHWREVFRLADVRLGRNDWAVGRYSIADIHLFRLFWRFVDTLHPTLSDYPNLSAHYDRMMARNAVKKTIAAESAGGYHFPR